MHELAQNKNTYHELSNEVALPLFFEPWWLDCVCTDGKWEVAMAFDKEGEISGVLPYFLTKYKGIKMIRMPILTPFLGPLIFHPEGNRSPYSVQSFERNTLDQLIEQLPVVPFTLFHCTYQIRDWLPFYWKGFHQTTRYSFLLKDLSDTQQIFQEFSGKVRNDIQHASKYLEVKIFNDAAAFYHLNRTSFKERGVKIPYSETFFTDLDENCRGRERCLTLLAIDGNGNPQAGAYLVWDHTSMYCLGLGRDPEAPRGAINLLIWEAIQQAAERSLMFDFEGSMIKGVANLFAGFGGELFPYFQLYKGKKWTELLFQIRSKVPSDA